MYNIEINSLLEKYLEPGECIQYSTQQDPAIVEKGLSDFIKIKKAIILVFFISIVFIFFENKSIIVAIFNTIVFFIFGFFFYRIINPILPRILSFVNRERYYYITNMRVITLEPDNVSGDRLYSLPIDDKLQFYSNYRSKNTIIFQQGYSLNHVMFTNISSTDMNYICELMKGVLDK